MEQKTVSGIVFAAASAEMALGRRVFQGPTADAAAFFGLQLANRSGRFPLPPEKFSFTLRALGLERLRRLRIVSAPAGHSG